MSTVEAPVILMFAGPNGSGKSTVTEIVRRQNFLPDNYVNADEIAKTLVGDPVAIAIQAMQIAQTQRQQLMSQRKSFAFETVMSHPSKLELLEQAKTLGYQIVLVFVATNNPQINVRRVALRVRQGGHDVPTDKIISRYYRSLDLLARAVEIADISYVFDNSYMAELIVQVVNDLLYVVKEPIPAWIQTALSLK
jgi:predicted ABC-type ATPase